jgi:hydroxylamine reductase
LDPGRKILLEESLMAMFCYQCQEAATNEGCTVRGVCGKEPEVAHLQDLLIWQLKGLSFWATRARNLGVVDPETDLFVAKSLFATITNANFDPQRFVNLIREAVDRREALRMRAQSKCKAIHGSDACSTQLPEAATWIPQSYNISTLDMKGRLVGILSDPNQNEDIRSLRELLVIGLKGLAAYTDHASLLGFYNDELFSFTQDALDATLDDKQGVNELVTLVLKAGEMGVEAMRLLDEANTSTFGHPEPTEVNLGVKSGPGILVSGHDLLDLLELLQQTEHSGINIYTHGEMLPAHAYPVLKKYPHFVGNYGGSWWHQKEEFDAFGGPILMTTNCVIPVRESYRERLFTTGLAGYPGCPHIGDRKNNQPKDFSALIEKAKTCPSPQALEEGKIIIGFARNTVMSVADQVIDAVKSGAVKRFVVMGGCDGRHKQRSYYTKLAEALPEDNIILTAGCAKYRYNKLDLGDIGSIPRLLDAGQCNDSYSLAYIALQLKEAFGLEDINDLPISYDIAWYEQKAVIVLLALLYLGVKKIRLGPTLPAFLSPGVLKILVDNFDIMPISSVENDLEAIAAGA